MRLPLADRSRMRRPRERAVAGSVERVNAVTVQAHDSARPVVDWSVAAATGTFLVRGGPAVPQAEAQAAVTHLRTATMDAEAHVRALTGLGADLPLLPAHVVDRREWIRSATQGLGALTSTAMPEGQRGPLGPLLAGGAGMQTGAILAFLAARVLGQYDPFAGPEAEGRLLLVAPNVVTAQRAMKVPARDFRMWVCLHECTHRLQFTAIDWLRHYFAEQVQELVGGVSDNERLGDLVGRLPQALRAVRRSKTDSADSDASLGLAELLQSPQQRLIFDRLLALSTLLEGHADYVMDAVGPSVVPSVDVIRRRFTERRKGGGPLDRLLRRLLGVDAKVRQYAKGAAFVRHVVDQVGMAGFNAVWTSSNTLPSKAEIDEPESWVRRVHG